MRNLTACAVIRLVVADQKTSLMINAQIPMEMMNAGAIHQPPGRGLVVDLRLSPDVWMLIACMIFSLFGLTSITVVLGSVLGVASRVGTDVFWIAALS